MSAMKDPTLIEFECGSKKEELESLLDAIAEALEDDLNCSASYVNEFGDFSIAIPLDGNQNTLDKFIEKHSMFQYLGVLAERFVLHAREKGNTEVTCSFIGFDQEEAFWINDNDERTCRLKSTLKSLIDSLSMQGVSRYLVGESFGCVPIVAEIIRESNAYLEASKEWEGVPGDWKPVEVEELPEPLEGGAPLIDRADIVVALAYGNGDSIEETRKSRTLKTLTEPAMMGKPAIVFWATWFEANWPAVEEIGTLLPDDMMERSVAHDAGYACDSE